MSNNEVETIKSEIEELKSKITSLKFEISDLRHGCDYFKEKADNLELQLQLKESEIVRLQLVENELTKQTELANLYKINFETQERIVNTIMNIIDQDANSDLKSKILHFMYDSNHGF